MTLAANPTTRDPGLKAPATETPVALFVDYSNLWISTRSTAQAMHESPAALRIEARRLREVMADGRPVSRAILVANASTPPAVLAHFGEYFEVLIAEAGRETGAEQAADERLQNRILLTIMAAPAPETIVVATGDGAGVRRGIGFIATLTVARRHGWGVEVLAFGQSLHDGLRRFATDCGVLVSLESLYYAFTFIAGGRQTQRAAFGYRPRALPRRWRPGEADRALRRTVA